MNFRLIKVRFFDWITRRRECGPIKSLILGLIVGLVCYGVWFLMYGWETNAFIFCTVWGSVGALLSWVYLEFIVPWLMRRWSRRYDEQNPEWRKK